MGGIGAFDTFGAALCSDQLAKSFLTSAALVKRPRCLLVFCHSHHPSFCSKGKALFIGESQVHEQDSECVIATTKSRNTR